MPGEKGSYRSVYSAIWDDPEFQAFPPTDKLLFLYLRTCPECNWPCIFPFYRSLLHERLNDITPAELDKAWDNLCHAPSPWLIYERPLLWIVKGMKNEPSYSTKNPNHAAGVISILKTLPKLAIINKFTAYYGLDFKIDAPGNGIGDGIPHPMGYQGTGTGTGTGEGLSSGKPDGPPPNGFSPDDMVTLWNEAVDFYAQDSDVLIPKILKLTDGRKKKAATRIKDCGINRERWLEIINAVHRSKFLSGKSPGKGHEDWKANFDFVLRSQETVTKILEGGYS